METQKNGKTVKTRYFLLDELRGLTLLSMLGYHAVWDIVYIFGVNWQWYRTEAAHWWQQSICCTFILLSGFCLSFSRSAVRRGAIVFAGGAVITAVTALAMPSNLVLFGVLTLIGSCMMIVGAAKEFLCRIPAWAGVAGSGLLFAITRNVARANVRFYPMRSGFSLVAFLRDNLMAYLGFPQAGFYSTDYFPLIPWLFLFLMGFYLNRWMSRERMEILKHSLCPPLGWIGRHCLLIYMLHQPVIYGALSVFFLLKR